MTTPRIWFATGTLATVLALEALSAWAQTGTDIGRREYEGNCAVCHGVGGKGDGPFADYLTLKRNLDLTRIQERNGGVFPLLQVMDTIDGRRELSGHGTREMPIWGRDYLTRAKDAYRGEYLDTPFNPERFVEARILGLADYLFRLQAK